METFVPCGAVHTKYQPNLKVWKCPKCGANADHFYIECFDDNAEQDCDQLHKNDSVACERCNLSWSGATIAKLIARAEGIVPCQHCKGTGFVRK